MVGIAENGRKKREILIRYLKKVRRNPNGVEKLKHESNIVCKYLEIFSDTITNHILLLLYL